MAECKNCRRKFRIRGKIITEKTPDYVLFHHPRRGGKPMLFCSRSCMFKFFARDLARAIIYLAKT